MSVPVCKGFDGNPDLYGLGIRIGVYLQWFSSWLSVSFEPSSAQETHDANSIFVFAIVIAIVQAAGERTIRPIEAYIMTQICSGYLFTVLSILGVRLQLLGGARLGRLVESITRFRDPYRAVVSSVSGAVKEEQELSGARFSLRAVWGLARRFGSGCFTVPMSAISFLKQDVLSWSGVLWRCVIAGMVASCNIWLWFAGLRRLPSLQSPTPCAPVVFIFAKYELRQTVISFLRTMSVIYGVIVYTLLSYVVAVGLNFLAFGCFCLLRQFSFRFAERPDTGAHRLLQKLLKAGTTIGLFTFLPPEFWTTPAENIAGFSDLLKALIFLSSGQGSDSGGRTGAPYNPRKSMYLFLSGLWHVWLLLVMIWFILSIELTIRWNHIQGVDTVQSTGQLIPFIIGIASTCSALQRIILALVKNKYPDWDKTDLDIRIGYSGSITFEIVRRNNGQVAAADGSIGATNAVMPMQNFGTGAWA